ncbi:MAG: hypothetical protein J2P59_12855, partial [Acidimicrobiales bacterium]|nr:hypothetical protein [Acidimicrobiales bacterium]
MGLSGENEGQTGPCAVNPEQERPTSRIDPVGIEVAMEVLPVQVDVTAVELREVVVLSAGKW